MALSLGASALYCDLGWLRRRQRCGTQVIAAAAALSESSLVDASRQASRIGPLAADAVR